MTEKPLDLGAVLKMLAQEHELEPDLKDPKLSSLAAIQTALLCDIAKSLRVLVETTSLRTDSRDRTLRVNCEALGIDQQLLERAVHDAVRRAHEDSHRMRYEMRPMGQPTDYGKRSVADEFVQQFATKRQKTDMGYP